MGRLKLACLFSLASAMAVPVTLAAQSAPPAATVAPGKPQTDDQLRGEARFMKTCFLCHNPTAQTRRLNIAVTNLVGLFNRPGITEQYVRERIQGGIPGRMPAYEHTYTSAQLDELIAYLKIR